MKLYVTATSPYARIVRIVLRETGLQDRVELVTAQTRTAGSPYYAINPSGRVPYLVLDDGTGLEDSALITDWLDRLDGAPIFAPPAGAAGWELRRLEARARSLMDGVSVSVRELRRPAGERSPTILDHEAARARRLVEWWAGEIGHPLMTGALTLPQITLACALEFAGLIPGFDWRPGHPGLAAWLDAIAARPSFAETSPLPR